MAFIRLYRRFSAWLALLAMVLGALAPTVTQAMVASGEKDGWLQICSVSGMVWVKAETPPAGDVPGPASGMPKGGAGQSCAWCTLHGGWAGWPTHDGSVVLPVQTCGSPVVQFVAPPVDSTWTTALSRAPPSGA